MLSTIPLASQNTLASQVCKVSHGNLPVQTLKIQFWRKWGGKTGNDDLIMENIHSDIPIQKCYSTIQLTQ